MNILPLDLKKEEKVINKTYSTELLTKDKEHLFLTLEKKVDFTDESYCKISTKNKIKFCNSDFIQASGYSEKELLNQDYSVLTHPFMPKIILLVIENSLQNKQSIIAILKNKSKDGSYYWTKSSITPNLTDRNLHIAYSVKSKGISLKAKREIDSLYSRLYKIEKHLGVVTASKFLIGFLEEKGMSYSEFINNITSEN